MIFILNKDIFNKKLAYFHVKEFLILEILGTTSTIMADVSYTRSLNDRTWAAGLIRVERIDKMDTKARKILYSKLNEESSLPM